jgi:predicted RNA-binding Zn-ribbon protein involved in translation (DUF1610 family)
MREGLIWQAMLRRGTFSPYEIINDLNPPEFMLSYVKRKVYGLIRSQLKANLLEVVSQKPEVYRVKLPKPELYQNSSGGVRKCQICGKEFFPMNSAHVICQDCKPIYRQKKCREIRRRKGARDSYFWSEEELRKLRETFPELRFNREKAKELSCELNRSVIAIKKKLIKLRRERKWTNEA